jgi:hypothetical protein
MLAGHVCGQPKSTNPSDQDARERCTAEQRQALRTEFGYDLGRLSRAERGKLDATCSRFRTNLDVEPYLKCLAEGLASLRPSWAPEKSRQSSPAPQTVVASAEPGTAPTLQRSSVFTPLLAGVVLAVVAVAVVVLKKRSRRLGRRCCECGTAMQSAGDLCPECRHRAAAAVKQSIVDRAEHERAEQEAQRRQQAEAEEQQRQREELALRRQRDEEVRRAEQAQAQLRPRIVLSAPDDEAL